MCDITPTKKPKLQCHCDPWILISAKIGLIDVIMNAPHLLDHRLFPAEQPLRSQHPRAPISRVLRVWQVARLESGRSLEFMAFGDPTARPILFLHSMEFATAPPWTLCLAAKDAGFQVIAVRRPGFGKSSPTETLEQQTASISELLDLLGLDDLLLHAVGSSGRLACNLLLSEPRIRDAVFSNFAFGSSALKVLKPAWVRSVINQALTGEASAELTLRSVKSVLKLRGAAWFLRQVCSRSQGDLAFIEEHDADLADATLAFSSLTATGFREEVLASSLEDDILYNLKLKQISIVSIIGSECSSAFREEAKINADFIGANSVFAESGDLFCGMLKIRDNAYFWDFLR